MTSMMACSGEQETEQESAGGGNETEENTAEQGFDYQNADLTPYIQLGTYEGLSAERKKTVITDEDLEKEIAEMMASYGDYEKFTDRAVEEGDEVLADYKGLLDGVAFQGGTATNTKLTAAPNSGYIEGFAEAFVGQMPGQEFSFQVTFPADYKNTDLAGKEVTFVCTVHAIYGEELIVPELTDAFVQENFQYNTVTEFKIVFRESLEKQTEYENENAMYNALYAQIVDSSTVLAYPEGEVEALYESSRDMYQYYADMYSMTLDTFLATYVGTTDAQLKTDAENYVKDDLVFYALADATGSELTEEEYEEGLVYLAEMYGMTTDSFVARYGEDAIHATLNWEDVMKYVAEKAIITEVE